MLKVHVIGMGTMGKLHAQAYRDLQCELTDFEKADIVSIASPDETHYDYAKKALENGKHVFVEKPMCQTKEQLHRLYELTKESRLFFGSNMVLRTSPLFNELRMVLKANKMGKLYTFEGDYLYGRKEKILTGWRSETPNYSVMQGGGIHLIDLFLWLTDENPKEVYKFSNKIVTKDAYFKYDDYALRIVLCESGLIAKFTANFGCVHPHQHCLRIFGTKGSFLLDDKGYRTYGFNMPNGLSHLPPTKTGLIEDFISAIAKVKTYDSSSFFKSMELAL